jgi:hypothetical protein
MQPDYWAALQCLVAENPHLRLNTVFHRVYLQLEAQTLNGANPITLPGEIMEKILSFFPHSKRLVLNKHYEARMETKERLFHTFESRVSEKRKSLIMRRAAIPVRLRDLFFSWLRTRVDLRVVSLERCRLGNMPRNIFQGFTVLTELNLQYNNLTEFPSLTGLDALVHVYLSNNPLRRLSADSFPLPLLSHVYMRQCELEYIAPFTFRGCQAVTIVVETNRLRDESMTGAFSGFLGGGNGSVNLILCNNLFTYMPIDLPRPLLRRLDLNDNRIDAIRAIDFIDCRHLTLLHLNGNRLEKLPGGVFAYLTSIQEVELCYNLLEAWLIQKSNLFRYLRLNRHASLKLDPADGL